MILPDGTRAVIVPDGTPSLMWDSRKWPTVDRAALLDAYGRPVHVEPIPTAYPPDSYIVPERLLILYPPEKPWVQIIW